MDILLLMAPTTSSIGYGGRGDYAMLPDGALRKRREHQVVPFVYAGAAIMSPSLFADAPAGEFSLTKMFDRANEQERLFGLRLDGVWMHVGTPDAVRPRKRRFWKAWRRSSCSAKAGIQYTACPSIRSQPSLEYWITRLRAVMTVSSGGTASLTHDLPLLPPYIAPDLESGSPCAFSAFQYPCRSCAPLSLRWSMAGWSTDSRRARIRCNLARATLYLPTRRAGRLAREIFLDELKTDAAILPRIVAARRYRRGRAGIFGKRRTIRRRGAAGPSAKIGRTRAPPDAGAPGRGVGENVRFSAPLVVGGPASTLALAGDLARLMDDMVTRGVAWEALDKLVPDQFDKYWQHSLDFLRIARKIWPEHLKEIGRIEPAERRDRLIEAEAARLTAHHEGPVIAAGSTGSMPATAKFLTAVAGLKQGAVVLPGLDTDLDDEAWQTIGGIRDAQGKFTTQPSSNHPQFAMQGLLDRFGIKRSDVEILGTPAPQGRDVLVSETMRPSTATEQWHDRLAQPDVSAKIEGGMTNLAVVEAPNSEMEALAIAVAMREARHLDKSAALVTPDRALARRVMAALGRWNLEFDDSGGDALLDTPAGIFARLAAEAAAKGLEPPTLLALLKHPLFRLGGAHGAHEARHRSARTALSCAARGRRPEPADLRATSIASAPNSESSGTTRPPRFTPPSSARS